MSETYWTLSYNSHFSFDQNMISPICFSTRNMFPALLITKTSWSSLVSIITCALSGDKHPRRQVTFSDFTVFNWILWIRQFVISTSGGVCNFRQNCVIRSEWHELCWQFFFFFCRMMFPYILPSDLEYRLKITKSVVKTKSQTLNSGLETEKCLSVIKGKNYTCVYEHRFELMHQQWNI